MAFADPTTGLPPAPIHGAGGTPAALWCAGVRKRFGRRQALQGVSVEVPRGEVVGLLGPNGAGKTTLIKILLGLVRADAGEVMLLGRPGGEPRSRTGVGYLPELFRYQPWLTPDEVLALHGRLTGVSLPRNGRQQALAQVGLQSRARDRVGGFSKGMQQRLGLAVALIGEPAVVILDEPTSALDPLGRADVRDIVTGLRARGTTVLLNSHLLGEVERVCDRVIVLDRGRVVASGPLAELLGREQLRLRLDRVSAAVTDRLAGTGTVTVEGDWFTLELAPGRAPGQVPELITDLVMLGARVHAVEPSRRSLENTLIGLLTPSEDGS